MFCSKCGKEIAEDARFCFNCGKEVQNTSPLPAAQVEENNKTQIEYNILPPPPPILPLSPKITSTGEKSFMTTAILSIIPAPCGLHRFYTGHIISGLIQFFTSGLYFIWSAIDVLRILTNTFTDKNGRKLNGYTSGKATLLFITWIAFYSLFITAIINSATEAQKEREALSSSKLPTETKKTQNKAKETRKKIDSPSIPKTSPITVTPKPKAAETPAKRKEEKDTKDKEKPASPAPPQPKPVENTPKPLPTITQTKPYEAPILDGAIYLYPETKQELIKDGFSKTLKKLGLANIRRCNELMPIAAKKAAQNRECDAVMQVDISTMHSTKDNLVIYVWAKNGSKFYFTEKDLMEEGPVLTEQQKLAPLRAKHELMAEEVIKSQLNFPSTYDRHELGVFNSRTTPSCNEIMIEFSAKNAFGLELTYIATVQFDKNDKVVGFHMQEKQ